MASIVVPSHGAWRPNEIAFRGVWNAENSHLQSNLYDILISPHLTLWKKISTIFNRVMECIVRSICPEFLLKIAQASIVPCSMNLDGVYRAEDVQAAQNNWLRLWNPDEDDDSIQVIQLNYEPSQLSLTTPEGVQIKGIFYKHKNSTSDDIPTILCFNPNNGYAYGDTWNWLLKKGCDSFDQPFNVLVFDYPTPQLCCARDLVIYGDTLFQAARRRLGISERNLHFLGYSLGGAIGPLVAQMHPLAGRVVSLRSFASLHNVITDHEGVLNNLPFFARWVLAKLAAAIGWGIEASDALWDLREKTLFVYSRGDEVLPPSVTAVNAVQEWYNLRDDQRIIMQPKPGKIDNHTAPLRHYQDTEGNAVSNRIVNFLLGRWI